MFFAICGKNKQISLEELNIVKPQNLRFYNDSFFTFESDENENLLYGLGGIIKRGEIVQYSDLNALLENIKIVGTNDKGLGEKLKSEKIIRRYKNINMKNSDLEIKKKGKELIRIGSLIGIVKGYQNIKLYEEVDFAKPARSMNMGMMPAKLAHILINLAKNLVDDKKTVIYDPFVGSGTTGFIANFMGYDFLGSDIKIDYVQKNLERRKTNNFYNKNIFFEIFKQNIFEDLKISKKYLENLVVVTEGRLGPIVHKSTNSEQIKNYQLEVGKLYNSFLTKISNLFKSNSLKLPKMVFTIPYYINQNNFLESDLQELSKKLGRIFDSIDEVYSREGQFVGRKIIRLK